MFPGDIRYHHMKPGSIREGGVNKRVGNINSSSSVSKHALNQPTDVLAGYRQRQRPTNTLRSNEDRLGTINPNLFDLGIIKKGLQHPKTGQLLEYLAAEGASRFLPLGEIGG